MPLVVFFLVLISLLGILIGRLEKWDLQESIYFAWVTATTVGYGDYRPLHKLSRALAIVVAFLGLSFTGIMVGLAVNAANTAFSQTQDIKQVRAAQQGLTEYKNK